MALSVGEKVGIQPGMAMPSTLDAGGENAIADEAKVHRSAGPTEATGRLKYDDATWCPKKTQNSTAPRFL